MFIRRTIATIIDEIYFLGFLVGIYYLYEFLGDFFLDDRIHLGVFIASCIILTFIFFGEVFYLAKGSIGKTMCGLSTVSVYGKMTRFRLLAREIVLKHSVVIVLLLAFYFNIYTALGLGLLCTAGAMVVIDLFVYYYSKNFVRDNYLYCKVIRY